MVFKMDRSLDKRGENMREKSKGFTLLEATLILLIIGIIGVSAVPTLQSIRRQEVNKLVKELCLDLVTQRQNQHINSEDTYDLLLVNEDNINTTPFCGYIINKVGEIEPVEENIRNNKNIEITIVDATTITTPTGTSFTDASKSIPTISNADLNAAIDGATSITGLKFNLGKMVDESDPLIVYSALMIRVRNGPSETFVVFNYITGNYYTYNK